MYTCISSRDRVEATLSSRHLAASTGDLLVEPHLTFIRSVLSNMAQTELDLHPESKAFLEASKSLWDKFAAEGSMSVEKLRRTLEELGKVGGPGVAKDYQGTREELFVDSKEVEG